MDAQVLAQLLRNADALDQARLQHSDEARPQEIRVLNINLGTAKDPLTPLTIPDCRSIFVRTATDQLASVNLRAVSIDTMQDSVALKLNDSLVLGFRSKLFLDWSAQAGKTIQLVLFATAEFRAGSQVSVTGGGVSIIDGSSATRTLTTLVATTAAVVAAASPLRKISNIQNNTGASIWVGELSTVTNAGATIGYEVPVGATFQWRNIAALYAYSVVGGSVLNFEES